MFYLANNRSSMRIPKTSKIDRWPRGRGGTGLWRRRKEAGTFREGGRCGDHQAMLRRPAGPSNEEAQVKGVEQLLEGGLTTEENSIAIKTHMFICPSIFHLSSSYSTLPSFLPKQPWSHIISSHSILLQNFRRQCGGHKYLATCSTTDWPIPKRQAWQYQS
jgi:hypothetical protein